MTKIPDLKNQGQFELTVEVDVDDSLIIPEVNSPPTWLTAKDVFRKTVQIGHENGEREAGFDLSSFDSPEHFVDVLEQLDIHPYYGYTRFCPNRWDTEGDYYYYIWGNEDGMIVFGNNPITGEWRDGNYKDEGYASYIGIEGTQEFVERAYEIIEQEANYKDYDMSHRSFI